MYNNKPERFLVSRVISHKSITGIKFTRKNFLMKLFSKKYIYRNKYVKNRTLSKLVFKNQYCN